ncbi:MAG TPA: DUF4239 domain-containing protein [Gammaproteobacteria bacterium]|nr:DUF4239 domain-containing protein [Gammaproteobacteria bacterium]
MPTESFPFLAVAAGAALFLLMLAAAEAGRRVGIAKLARDHDGLAKGAASAEAAVFALLGLLIAFTFSGAASRFESRRHLIGDEANAIGTAYLRVDLLPANAQPEVRALFRRYVDARVTAFQLANDDYAAAKARLAAANALQADLWRTVIATARTPEASPQATMLLVPALNDMIDITTTRQVATENHPPAVVFILLVGLSLLGALLVGYALSPNKERTWLHVATFAAMFTSSSISSSRASA